MDGHSLPLCPSPPLLSLTLAPPPLPNTTKMHQNEQIPPSFSASLLIFSTLLLPFDPTTLSPRPSPRHPPSPSPAPVKSKIPSAQPKPLPRFLRRCCAFNAFCACRALPHNPPRSLPPSSFLYYLLLKSDGEMNPEGQEKLRRALLSAGTSADRSINRLMTQLIDLSMEVK